ncbi:hypothetical protein REPUB_Repub08aG0135800 [Reevesia pubescens]
MKVSMLIENRCRNLDIINELFALEDAHLICSLPLSKSCCVWDEICPWIYEVLGDQALQSKDWCKLMERAVEIKLTELLAMKWGLEMAELKQLSVVSIKNNSLVEISKLKHGANLF